MNQMATTQTAGMVHHLCRMVLMEEADQMTDEVLLKRFVTQGDESAFEVLVQRHGKMVLGVCRRVLADVHDSEDAFQATFLVLVRKAAAIRRPELLGHWLYGAAYRAALEAKALRRRSRERQVAFMPEPIAPSATPTGDLQLLLDREISRLPDKYRVPIVLCDLDGRTRREVAQSLGIPVGTLSGRLTTARRKLARRLTRLGVTVSSTLLGAALSHEIAAAVPPSLVGATVQAVTAVTAGQAAVAGTISAKVALLSHGVMKSLLLSKLKALLLVTLTVVLCGGTSLLLARHALGMEQTAATAGATAPLAANQSAATPEDEPIPKTNAPDTDKKDRPAARPYGYLGVMLATNAYKGQVFLQVVITDSPADKAELQVGDVLLKIGDQQPREALATCELLKATKPGDQITIQYQRGDDKKTVQITLGKWPAGIIALTASK
jgi:RNA polymerase sigma factor (sigma-70 family)